jgi:predicted ATPase/class 3 adenylate cyclase
VRKCTACGQENPGVARFCLACGAALASSPALPADEERRIVTVLFTDIVGSTASAEQLDPEDVHARLAPYYTRLRAELERHGGTVEKFIGDAVVALFGAPVAHEDDPERAVRAALAIRDAIDDLNEQDDWLDLRIRTAVHTGEALVVLGARAAEGEGIASGDVMNTAARLQSAAPVNGIVVGAETFRATRHVVEYRELEPVQAKGKSEPVPVWEVVAVRSDGAGRPSTGADLVGRRGDLDELRYVWELVRADGGRFAATIVGAPGIGKSRLIAEFTAIARADGGVYSGRCLPYGEGITYWPVGEIVKSAAAILQSDDAGAVAEKLGAFLRRLGTGDEDELRTMATALANLLDVSSTPEGTYAAAEISQAELHWGIRRVLELLALERPLVLVFEDLHWAEPTLLELLRFILEGTEPAPLLVLTSTRPELLEERPAITVAHARRRVLELGALTPTESEALLRRLVGAAALPQPFIEILLSKAGGNPLFLEETVRMLVDEELVDPSGVIDVAALENLPVPSSLQGLITSRLDRLSPTERRAAQHAAVVGQVFWLGVVSHLVGTNGRIAADLEGLERRDFVRPNAVSTVAGEREYAFKHILIRDVAYDRLPKGRRAELHVRCADWIVAIPGGEDDFVEIVAFHLEQACVLARELARSPISPPTLQAARLLARAAEKAERREGLREAERFYARALELVGEDHPETGTELWLGRAGIFAALGELGRAASDLAEVAERARELGRADLRCAALVKLGNVYQKQGRAADAREVLLEAEAIAADLGDRGLEIRAAYELTALQGDFGGAFEQAIEDLQRALRLAEDADDHALRVEGHLRMGFFLLNIGQIVRAGEQFERCSHLAGELGSHRDEARATFALGLVKHYRGERREANRLSLQAHDWLERTCDSYFQTQNLLALAVQALAVNDAESAERWLREAVPLALESGGWLVVEVYRYLADALARQGRLDEARELVEFARRSVAEEDLYTRAAVSVAQAVVATADEAREDAVVAFEEALELFEQQNLPIHFAEASLFYGRALRRFGDAAGAEAKLARAREIVEALEAAGLLSEVDEELAGLAERAGAPGPPA